MGWSVVFAMHIHKVDDVAKGSLSSSAMCQNNRISMSALWRQADTSRKSGYKWRRGKETGTHRRLGRENRRKRKIRRS